MAQGPSLESYSNNGFRSVAPAVVSSSKLACIKLDAEILLQPKVEVYRQTVVANDIGMRVLQQEAHDVSNLTSRSWYMRHNKLLTSRFPLTTTDLRHQDDQGR